MIHIQHSEQYQLLRRLALDSQGLLQTQPFGTGRKGAINAISHIGYVQIDTISVVERAHHHVLQARVPNYQPTIMNQLLLNGDIFEYWSHAAAFLPINDFRFSLPYKHAIKSGQTHWHKHKDKKLMQALLERISNEGPLRARDIESKNNTHTGWWDWKPAKKALEQLYMEGDLMVKSREGFQKCYDLSERVLPSSVNTSMPSIEEFAQHLINQQLRCHGLVSLKGITYLRRNASLRAAVKALINNAVSTGELEQVSLDTTKEAFFIKAGALEKPIGTAPHKMTILSPFDNSLIQRARLKTLFGYNYQIECYLPADKRRYGYFSLPLLYQDSFIGQMDCKAHRKDAHLEIKNLYFVEHHFEQDAIIDSFTSAIKAFCAFQACTVISLGRVNSPTLKQAIERSIAGLN